MKRLAAYTVLIATLIFSAGRLARRTIEGRVDYQKIFRPFRDASFDFSKYNIFNGQDALMIAGSGISLACLIGLGIYDVRGSRGNRQEEESLRRIGIGINSRATGYNPYRGTKWEEERDKHPNSFHG